MYKVALIATFSNHDSSEYSGRLFLCFACHWKKFVFIKLILYWYQSKESTMKVLTKNTDYAIRALLALEAQKGSYVSAKSIATGHDIPYQFLRRLLQEMIRHGRLRDVPENVKLSGQAFILFKDALVSFLLQVLYNIHYVNIDTLRGMHWRNKCLFYVASTNITWMVETVTISVRLDSSSPCFYFLYSVGQEK